jgi:glycosyltransferase involved in cell wall biosynthesis
MEAMAAGRAVIASDTGGNPMLIAPGDTGLLFRNGDRVDLVEQLRKLLASPATLQAMGQAGRERHRALFSRARAAEAVLSCIDSIEADPAPPIAPLA